MTRRKFRLRKRPGYAEETFEGPLGTSELYEIVGQIMGPLADDLGESDKRAASRLLDMTLHCAPVLLGLEELRQHFRWLGDRPGLDTDIAAIFRQSADHVYDGIQSCIFAPGGRVMDQSRFLMEVEFLLYDFVARPESLTVWRTAEPFRRNQQFGFGKLRRRRESDLGYTTDTVLPDREEYMVHSAQVHPRPAQELLPGEETPEQRRYFLTSDLADLFEHALRVLKASLDVVRVFSDMSATTQRDCEAEVGRPVEPELVRQAIEFVENWIAELEAPGRPSSVPLKGVDWRAAPGDVND